MQINLTLPAPHKGRLHGGQARIIREKKRYNVLDCGRRFGKTDCGQIVISAEILAGWPVGWFAPTYKILDDAWQEIKRVYRPIISGSNDSDRIINFVTGATLEGWSLDKEGAGISRKYALAIIDEAARAKNLLDSFNYNIRPTLADFRGSAWFLSTPKGLNDFFKLWQTAQDNPAEWASWKMTTYENPYIDPAEVDAMRDTMPGPVFQQEILAEFLENGSFFQGVENCCIIDAPDKPENHKGHRIVAGLDWAMSEDFTVLTVVCGTCGLAVDWYRVNRMDYTQQRAAIVDRLAQWPDVILLPERNSIGQPNIEMLSAAGLQIASGPDMKRGFNTTSSTKAELIQKLATSIERGEIKLPREYADELRAYEVTITSTNPKFSAPTGQHDDRVMSAALAWWAATSGSGWLEWARQSAQKAGDK